VTKRTYKIEDLTREKAFALKIIFMNKDNKKYKNRQNK
jgi:hypothetical protein